MVGEWRPKRIPRRFTSRERVTRTTALIRRRVFCVAEKKKRLNASQDDDALAARRFFCASIFQHPPRCIRSGETVADRDFGLCRPTFRPRAPTKDDRKSWAIALKNFAAVGSEQLVSRARVNVFPGSSHSIGLSSIRSPASQESARRVRETNEPRQWGATGEQWTDVGTRIARGRKRNRAEQSFEAR